MKTKLLMIVLQLASAGNDAYWTDHNQHLRNHYENNPFAQPFVGHRPALVTYFSVTTATKLTLPYVLRKHHHERLAQIEEILGIVDSGYGGITSAVHSH